MALDLLKNTHCRVSIFAWMIFLFIKHFILILKTFFSSFDSLFSYRFPKYQLMRHCDQ